MEEEQRTPSVKDVVTFLVESGSIDSIDEITCYACPLAVRGCDFAWEPYNTNGDCLAEK